MSKLEKEMFDAFCMVFHDAFDEGGLDKDKFWTQCEIFWKNYQRHCRDKKTKKRNSKK